MDCIFDVPVEKISGKSNLRSSRFRKNFQENFFQKEIKFPSETLSGHRRGTFDNLDEKSWSKVLKILLKSWKWSEKYEFLQKKGFFQRGNFLGC